MNLFEILDGGKKFVITDFRTGERRVFITAVVRKAAGVAEEPSEKPLQADGDSPPATTESVAQEERPLKLSRLVVYKLQQELKTEGARLPTQLKQIRDRFLLTGRINLSDASELADAIPRVRELLRPYLESR